MTETMHTAPPPPARTPMREDRAEHAGALLAEGLTLLEAVRDGLRAVESDRRLRSLFAPRAFDLRREIMRLDTAIATFDEAAETLRPPSRREIAARMHVLHAGGCATPWQFWSPALGGFGDVA